LPEETYPVAIDHNSVPLADDKRLSWRYKAESKTFQLELKESKDKTSDLGLLGTRGLMIDDPKQIQPVEIRGGLLKFKFLFNGEFWERGLDNSLAGFSRLKEAPPTVPLGPGLDPLNDPRLGAVVNRSRHAASSMFATLTDDGSTLKLRKESPAIELAICRDAIGWHAPFERPSAAVPLENGFLLLDDRGDYWGLWDDKHETPPRISPTGTDLATIWKTERGLFCIKRNGNQGQIVPLVARPDSLPEIPTEAVGEPEEEEITASIGLRRPTSSTTRLGFVWRPDAQSKWNDVDPWKTPGLPGTWIDAALWLRRDALIASDQYGLWAFSASTAADSAIHRPDKFSPEAVLIRHAGRVMISLKDGSVAVVEPDANGSGLNFHPQHASSGDQDSGAWKLRQERRDATLAITAEQYAAPSVSIGEQTLKGALSIDIISLLGVLDQVPLVAFPIGVRRLDGQGPVVVADRSVRPRISPANSSELSLLRTRDGKAFLGRSNVPIAALEGGTLQAIKGAPEAHDYLYFREPTDWRVYVEPMAGHQVMTLERPVQTDHGADFDTMRGGEVFAEGQFAFDRVQSVTRNPANDDSLLVETRRGLEEIVLAPVSDGRPSPPRVWPGPQLRVPARNSLSASWATNGERRAVDLVLDAENLQLMPGTIGVTTDPAFPLNKTPSAVQASGRVWITLPEGIHWVEAEGRWSRRRRELMPTRQGGSLINGADFP
jgi:hypothetical protein